MSFATLLKENDNALKEIAISQMLTTVDQNWTEIGEHISLIESLSEDLTFPNREEAAYLCAKIYYHLDNLDEAVSYALQSRLFQLTNPTDQQFIHSLIRHCIDQYIQKQEGYDPKRVQLIERVIRHSCEQGNHISAIGVAIDCKRIDIIRDILNSWKNPQKMIQVLNLFNTIQRGEFREKLLQLSVDLIYKEAEEGQIPIEEWSHFVTVLVQLGEASKVADILWSLVCNNKFKTETPLELALQLCIDLADNQKPQFNQKVIAHLPIDQAYAQQRDKLVKLLNGEHQRKVLHYYHKTFNKTDSVVLTGIKGTTDPKFSVPHGAAIMAHGYAQVGTQDAEFLKNNQKWATECKYWQRFTATSSLGLVHKYNWEESQQLLATHLNPTNLPFEIGGAYYAHGLISFASNDKALIQKCVDHLQQQNTKEYSAHGALLGAGLIAFASEDETLHQIFKGVIGRNESVYGEGAGISLGLLHAGSASKEKAIELLELAHQSDKDKISRSLSLAIACILFHQEDRADTVIETMIKDNNPTIRYGGCFALGMAYAGTASNKVIQKLLQISVEDVSDDVRRAAVINFGFLMFKNYESVHKIMRLLILSYNPHIRYGTAMALGIACAGTMHADAITMLEPMLNDNVDFVRQGALIALGMVLSQANKECEPKFEQIQKLVSEMATRKHETVLAKLGTILCQGLLEAGGRNMVVSLQSRQGVPKLDSCVGMLWFLNYWFWFPCLSMLGLAFQSTGFIGLDENLNIPKDFQIQCNTKQFEYPTAMKTDEKKVVEKKTAQLSTTNKVKAKNIRKEAEKREMGQSIGMSRHESKLSVEAPSNQPSGVILNKHTSAIIEEPLNKGDKEKQQKPKDEPVILQNPCRVLEKQRKYLQLLEGSRYSPLLKDLRAGLVVLIDSTPKQFADVILMNPQAAAVEVPEEFVFDESKQLE